MEKRLDVVGVILDTNIIIDVLRNRQSTIDLVDGIGDERLHLSAVTMMELYHGARNKAELLRISKLTSSMKILEIEHGISVKATQLVYDYGIGHNCALPDALIAATAILTGFELFTYNEKDFRFLPGVKRYEYQ